MLIVEIKSKNDIISLCAGLDGKVFIICCTGCSEVYFPQISVTEMCKLLIENGDAYTTITTDHICNPDNLRLQLDKYNDEIHKTDCFLVFSCGVGVQTVASGYNEKHVFAGCDTYPLPGFQGITPLEYDCIGCIKCHLNDTYGICPVTSCSKSLIHGQCGGSKNGMCEADSNMECGWERIYNRIRN